MFLRTALNASAARAASRELDAMQFLKLARERDERAEDASTTC